MSQSTIHSTLSFEHPCFSNHGARVARIHLAVAPYCNIKCAFCRPTVNPCIHGCAPGLANEILTPQQALEHLRRVRESGIDIRIVGIAGPGEPLANPETFETLRLIKAEYPQIHLCLSTNGLFLPEQASRLAQLGVETLTVTVNAHTPNVAVHIYEHVSGERGENAVRRLLERQRTGVKEAVKAGMVVKINSVYVPGINDDDILQISREMRAIGATLQNILPVIARDTMAKVAPPDAEQLEQMRERCGVNLEQFVRCKHCRADAIVDAEPSCAGK